MIPFLSTPRCLRSLRKVLPSLALCLLGGSAPAKTLRVLFIGNSYTAVNDLPQLVSGLAQSAGDQLIYSTSAPGGTTFQQHLANTTTTGLIAQGNWDYVVLQEQSQLPSFPEGQVAAQVYPFARKLDSLVRAYSPCAKTTFYMTWGRKNGDAQNCPGFPPLCSYGGMDSLLQRRYTVMADSNRALLSPVAKVWRRLRATQPGIELYDLDESHPSAAGSYAAACTFYAVLFEKNPALCTYNYSLNGSTAGLIRNAAKAVAFDSLGAWRRALVLPQANFTFSISGSTVAFTNQSQEALSYRWHFGDGDSSTAPNPTHQYAANGSYQVRLIAARCGDADTAVKTVTVAATGLSALQGAMASLAPNPAGNTLRVRPDGFVSEAIIVNGNGAVVWKRRPGTAQPFEADLRGLAPGLYFLRLTTDKGSVHLRFQKQ